MARWTQTGVTTASCGGVGLTAHITKAVTRVASGVAKRRRSPRTHWAGIRFTAGSMDALNARGPTALQQATHEDSLQSPRPSSRATQTTVGERSARSLQPPRWAEPTFTVSPQQAVRKVGTAVSSEKPLALDSHSPPFRHPLATSRWRPPTPEPEET
jgi:hypothetical protein